MGYLDPPPQSLCPLGWGFWKVIALWGLTADSIGGKAWSVPGA